MTAIETFEWRAKWQDMPDVAKEARYRDALIPESIWPLADRLGDRYEWDGDSQFMREIARIRTARKPYPGIAIGERYREITRRVVYCDGTTRHFRYRLPVAGTSGRVIPGVASRERGGGHPLQQSGAIVKTIGSSSVAAILGISPWATPMSVWADLVGLTTRDDNSDSRVKRRGHIIEPALRDEHARTIGRPIVAGPAYEAEPLRGGGDCDWAHARPDGWYFLPDPAVTTSPRMELTRVVEIKTARSFDDWGPDGSADIPAYYAAQCVWEMGIMWLGGHKIHGADLVAYCPMSEEIRTFKIDWSESQFRTMLEVVGDWHKAHVIGNTPPPVDGSEATRKVLAKLYPGNVEKVTLDATASDLADKALIIAADNEIATIEISRDAAKNRLMERIGKANATHIRGVCAWSPTKGRTSFDSKAALAADPSLSRFQTVGEPSRRFTLTEK